MLFKKKYKRKVQIIFYFNYHIITFLTIHIEQNLIYIRLNIGLSSSFTLYHFNMGKPHQNTTIKVSTKVFIWYN